MREHTTDPTFIASDLSIDLAAALQTFEARDAIALAEYASGEGYRAVCRRNRISERRLQLALERLREMLNDYRS